jgi:tetratricopeptide (TPR) repeat protein
VKRDLPLDDPMLAQALAAETALAQAHDAKQQGELALALAHAQLAHAQLAHAQAPLAGLRAAAGLLACFCHFRLGQYLPLLALGEELLALVAEPARRLELLRWLTVAGAETGHYALAQRVGAEATSLAEHAGDDAAQSAVRQAVALCYARMGDPWRCEQLMCDGLAQAESQPVLYPLLASLRQLAEATIDQFHLMPHRHASASTDTLARASSYVRRAQAAAERIGDEHFRAFLDGLLGEALLHQDQLDDAWPMLERALCQAQAHGLHPLAWRMDCTLAEGLLRRREPREALLRLETLLGDGGEAMPPTLQQRAHRAMVRACQALGQHERAAMHQAQVDRLASLQTGWRSPLPVPALP